MLSDEHTQSPSKPIGTGTIIGTTKTVDVHFQMAIVADGVITVEVPEIVEGRAAEAAAQLARTCLRPPWAELSLAMARALREELLAAGVTRLTIVAELGGEGPELLVKEPPEVVGGG